MEEETTWEIIDACVPRGTAEKLARHLSRSAELINRWKRQPEDDEHPSGTGSLNPIDIVEAIQDHAFAHSPSEVHRIHLYFQRRYERFSSAFKPTPLTRDERDLRVAGLVREHAEVLEAILTRLPPDRVRKEWEDLKRLGEEIVTRIEAASDLPEPPRRPMIVKKFCIGAAIVAAGTSLFLFAPPLGTTPVMSQCQPARAEGLPR